MPFAPGQRVAWCHDEAPKHIDSSILRESALKPHTPVGEVVALENERATLIRVAFAPEQWDGERGEKLVAAHGAHTGNSGELILTSDELVQVASE